MFKIVGKTLIILEDHPSCRFIYEKVLGGKNTLHFITTIEHLLQVIRRTTTYPDLLVLDIKLPDGLLTDYLGTTEMQRFFSRVPTLVVSSLGDGAAMRSCYDQGIFDYLVKPYDSNELLIRLERLLQVQLKNRFLTEQLGLTATEVQIIELFFKKSTLLITKDDLKQKIWQNVNVVAKTYDVHLSNLRKKLLTIGYSIIFSKDHTWKIVRGESSGGPRRIQEVSLPGGGVD